MKRKIEVSLLAAMGVVAACGGNSKPPEAEPTARVSSALGGAATLPVPNLPPGVGYLATPTGDYRPGTAVCKGNAKFIVVTTKHGPTNGSAGSGGEFTIDGTTYPDGNCSYLLDPDPAPPSPPSFISDVRVCVFPMGSNPYPSTIAPALGTLPQDGAYEGTLYDAYTCLPSANPPSACIAPDFTVTPRRAKLTMTYTVGLSEANDCDDRLAVAGRQYPATNGKLFEGTTPSGLHSNDGGSAWITWDNECSGDEGGNDDDGDCTKVPHYRGLAAGVHNDGNSDGKGLIVCISAFTQAEVDWIQAQCSAL